MIPARGCDANGDAQMTTGVRRSTVGLHMPRFSSNRVVRVGGHVRSVP